jgi:hypothetical protein
MKKNRILVVIPLLLVALFIIACDNKGSSNESGKAAVKIDDDVITIDTMEKFYYVQNKLILNKTKEEIDNLAKTPAAANYPSLNRAKFADIIISRKLLYKKAMADEDMDKDELNAVMELNKINGVATFYLIKKLGKDINVTDKEVEAFYTANRNLFKGVPLNDQVLMKVKQQIFMKKFELLQNQFIMNLIAESKVNREGYKKFIQNKLQSATTEKEEKAEEPAKK